MSRAAVSMLVAAVLCVGMAGCGERERLKAQLQMAAAEREELRTGLLDAEKEIEALQARLADTGTQNDRLRTQCEELRTGLQNVEAKLTATLLEQEKWRKAAEEAKVTIAQKQGEIKERDAAITEIRKFLEKSDESKEALRKELDKEKNAWWLEKTLKDLFPPPPEKKDQ